MSEAPVEPTGVIAAKPRKTLYLILAAAGFAATIGLMLYGFGALNDYRLREDEALVKQSNSNRLASDRARPAESVRDGPRVEAPSRNPAREKAEQAEKDAVAARLIADGSRSVMIGTFAASAGLAITSLGLLLMAFQKPKAPPRQRKRRNAFADE